MLKERRGESVFLTPAFFETSVAVIFFSHYRGRAELDECDDKLNLKSLSKGIDLLKALCSMQV